MGWSAEINLKGLSDLVADVRDGENRSEHVLACKVVRLRNKAMKKA